MPVPVLMNLDFATGAAGAVPTPAVQDGSGGPWLLLRRITGLYALLALLWNL